MEQFFSFIHVNKSSKKLSDFGSYFTSHGPFYEVYPNDSEELCRIIAIAYENKIPIRVRGYGHSMNGSSLPKRNELLIRCDNLNEYEFQEENTITVGAGVKVWDLQHFVQRFGFHLRIFNGGDSAPSIGGFVSAGGIGDTGDDDSFWNVVQEIELISGWGKVIIIRRTDEVFPWLFGSMGQLGCISKVKVQIVPLQKQSYPKGLKGNLKALELATSKWIWFTLFYPVEKLEDAMSGLNELDEKFKDVWIPLNTHRHIFKYRLFNPPLIYPFDGHFFGSPIWGSPKQEQGFDLNQILRLERDFHKFVCSDPQFRRYIQSEIIPEGFNYQAYFGKKIYAKFLKIKKELDPRLLFNRGN